MTVIVEAVAVDFVPVDVETRVFNSLSSQQGARLDMREDLISESDFTGGQSPDDVSSRQVCGVRNACRPDELTDDAQGVVVKVGHALRF